MWTFPPAILGTVVSAVTDWFLDNFVGSAPASSGNVLTDTFTGTSSWGAHTSDSGNTWSGAVSGSFITSHANVASGVLKVQNGWQADGVSSAFHGPGRVVITASIEITNNGNTGDDAMLIGCFHPGTAIVNPSINVTLGLSNGDLSIQLTPPGSSVTINGVSNGTYVFRLEVDEGVQSVFWGGQLVLTGSASTLSLVGRQTYVALYGDSSVHNYQFGLSSVVTDNYSGGILGPSLTSDVIALNDLFAGSTALSAHTSDSGATWIEGTAFGDTITNLSVTGGNLVTAFASGFGVGLSSIVLPDPTCTFDVDLVLSTVAGAETNFLINPYVDGSITNYLSLRIKRTDDGNVTVYEGDSATVYLTTTFAAADGAHSLRWTIGATEQRVYWNGTFQGGGNSDMSGFAGRDLYVRLNSDGVHASQIAVTSMKALSFSSSPGHLPDIGAVYTTDTGSLNAMVLDGSGNLDFDRTAGGAYANSVAGPSTVPYSIEAAFTIADVGASDDQFWIDLVLVHSASGNWLIEMFARRYGSPARWELDVIVTDVGGSTLFDDTFDVDDLFTVGSEHKIKALVQSNGTLFLVDDVVVSGTPQIPDALPDQVEFEFNIPTPIDPSCAAKTNYVNGKDDVALETRIYWVGGSNMGSYTAYNDTADNTSGYNAFGINGSRTVDVPIALTAFGSTDTVARRGDLIIMHFIAASSGNFTGIAPAGWTALQTGNLAKSFYRFRQAGDPDLVSITINNATSAIGYGVEVWRNVLEETLDVNNTYSSPSSGHIAPGTVTSDTDGGRWLMYWASNQSNFVPFIYTHTSLSNSEGLTFAAGGDGGELDFTLNGNTIVFQRSHCANTQSVVPDDSIPAGTYGSTIVMTVATAVIDTSKNDVCTVMLNPRFPPP